MIYELIKALEVKTSIVFDLFFANNTILLCFFFFLIVELYFLISVFIAQIFDPTGELALPIGILTKEAEIETHPVTAEAKTSRCSI